jgi:capsular polysaccharide biosynthesis protein
LNAQGQKDRTRVGAAVTKAEKFWDENRPAAAEFVSVEDYTPADYPMPFVSLGYVWWALKRRRRFWCGTALAGLIIGLGLFATTAPGHHATISLLLVNDPTQQPSDAITTAATLAQSQAVAAEVVQQLGISETPGAFSGSYTVTTPTTQVLAIEISAPSDAEAVRRATTLATVFLSYRANLANKELQLEVANLNQQVTAAQATVSSLDNQISNLKAEPATAATQTGIEALQAKRSNAEAALSQVQQYASTTQATDRLNTASVVKESQILDSAATAKTSAKRRLVLDVGGPLMGGLVLGMAIVIVGALLSDRMRRRDDIAAAIGAPVTLSVASAKFGRRPTVGNPRNGQRAKDFDRVVTHLSGLSRRTSSHPAALVVVSLDNVQATARAVEALALLHADRGARVMVADLTPNASLAKLLGAATAGVRQVTVAGQQLRVAVPEKGEVAPNGPLSGKTTDGTGTAYRGSVLAADAGGADLVLTLTTLDPAVGGDHLSTWATEAAVLLTAGESSIARVRAAGEMARHAETHIVSVILLGADTNDESTGMN